MTRPFEGVFGNTCELRLLEFLLPLDGMAFNITELSEEAGVSRVTVGRVVKKFVEWGILTATNDRIPQYSINPASPIVRSLEIMNNSLIGRMLGDEKVQEIRDYIREHTPAASALEMDTSNDPAWPYCPEMPEPGIGWGAGDPCGASGSGPLYPISPPATADDYNNEFPGYIQ
ncbi:winged helix-turn-helix domain-containing protein [Methanofollis tationis]|uniref:Winged helix-turn-helix transcriptional regulator n=1 Tax=Methanofollis tationis TaxID=81417 RepID=A0A7K4HPE5_9EURY|nr:winged helix-turn-helix domain-containing protein [Methanofollis tationis]NVO66937.1 winged helix-turn-helix transcriptional regulator [Methanofollis tationis]